MAEMLAVIDMQNDFLTGSLPVKGALEMVGRMQNYLMRFISKPNSNRAILTACWHPEDHCSFKIYGPHCVQYTYGAEIQIGLQAMIERYQLRTFLKGMNRDKEEHSGLDNEELVRYIKNNDITDIELCGVARDICVEATAQAALKLGLRVKVLEELCVAVDPDWRVKE